MVNHCRDTRGYNIACLLVLFGVIVCSLTHIFFFFCSTTVFGVSTESMQLSYDARGNSVPTILLMMQRHLYAQGGLRVCIFT